MIKKKEGASLIVVIIIFMFVSSVSIGMLSMISANYKARVSESKRVENLYSSESGLDVAYNIMVKTFDAATTYGYYEVEALKTPITGNPNSQNNENYQKLKNDINILKTVKIKQSQDKIKSLRDSDGDNREAIKTQNNNIQRYNELIDEDNQMIEILLNEEFKRAFKYFINDSPNQLKNSITNKTYVNDVTGINGFETVNVNIQSTTEQLDEYGDKEIFPKLSAEEVKLINTTKDADKDSAKNKKSIKAEADGHSVDVTIDIIENDMYAIILQSIFQSTKQKTNTESVGNNLRTVQAKYNIFVPEYSDIFFGKGTDNVSEYVVLENKALMVGKEMIINGTNSLNVTGNVFVEGKLDDPNIIDGSNRTYEKYNGGIRINCETVSIKEESDPDNIVFNNDVITRGTFNFQDSMKVKVAGNLYANNLYAGGKKIINLDESSDGSRLNASTVILDNDLTVKADDTHIEMNNFYGINDKNTKFDGGTKSYYHTTNSVDDVGKERTSSSIIVNSPEANSTVNISNEAYIMGVAHINTTNGYQTGESVAVKGNYSAYSVPLDSKEQFIPDSPLQVLNEPNVFNKAKHFSDYWNKTSDGDIGKYLDKSGPKANNGGITLPDKIYSTGAIVYKDGDNKTIVKPSQYTLNVEAAVNDMRTKYASQVYRMGAQSDIADYDNLGKHADSVEDLLDLTPDILQNSSYSASNELGVNKKEVAIFSMNSIEIDGDKIKVDGQQYTIGSTINAVIVTKGDVNIKGNVNFNGNIIACGNLNIGSGNIIIKYDEEIINRIKLKNSTLFKNVFKNIATKEVPESTSSKEVSLNDIKSQYDIGKFLQNKLWRIVENIK